MEFFMTLHKDYTAPATGNVWSYTLNLLLTGWVLVHIFITDIFGQLARDKNP